MKVLSWDVGIINLAYCLLEILYDEKKKPTYKVYEWGLIDLSRKKEKLCQVCKKNASLKYETLDNIEEYFCKTHGKKYLKPDIPEINSFFKDITKKDNLGALDPKKCCECEKDARRCFNNKNYCMNHGRNFYKKLLKNIELVPLKKEKTIFDIDILRYNLVEELDRKPELFKAEKVLIENQPSLKNPRMKAISSTIYDFYLIRGIFDKKYDSKINQVRYMSPSNKIKLSKDKQIVKEADKTKKYKLTKQLAVNYVKEILDSDLSNFRDYFLGVKKKDDLADAFLQGAYYLTFMNK